MRVRRIGQRIAHTENTQTDFGNDKTSAKPECNQQQPEHPFFERLHAVSDLKTDRIESGTYDLQCACGPGWH